MGLSLLPLTRCFYHQTRQVFDRPLSFWIAYYIDLAVFVYGTGRLLFLAIVLDSPALVSHFRTIDPAVASLSAVGGSSFLMGFMWIFEVFHVFCRISLARINVESWHFCFLRAVVVQLQDNYYRCALNPTLQKRFRQRIAKKDDSKIKLIVSPFDLDYSSIRPQVNRVRCCSASDVDSFWECSPASFLQ